MTHWVFRTKNSTVLKKYKGCSCAHVAPGTSGRMKYDPGRPRLSNGFTSLAAYQIPKSCTEFYQTMRKDFTAGKFSQ